MAKITAVLKSKGLQALITERKLKLVSTEKQLENGTIALIGKIKRQPVSYKVTANGAVLSNEYVARRVSSYAEGFKAVAELVEKRQLA
jgi:hydrogenase maturation factor HypF (carbamoyltransferase family)